MSGELRTCPLCRGRSRRGGVCRRCEAETHQRLLGLLGWWVELETTIVKQDQLTEPNGGHSADEWRWPYNIGASRTAAWAAGVIATWVHLTITDLHAPAPRRWPATSRHDAPNHLGHLTAWWDGLRVHADFARFAEDVHTLTTSIMWAVDRPEVKASIHVGPCYLTTTDGDACPGTVWAQFPHEDAATTWAPHMQCTAQPDHVWPSVQWSRAGVLIARRREQLAHQQQLAAHIAHLTTNTTTTGASA